MHGIARRFVAGVVAMTAALAHFLGCTFPGFQGTDGKRAVTITSPDELTFTNAGRTGGARGESVWRRIT